MHKFRFRTRYSLAHRLSSLEEAFATQIALSRVARLARPAAALRVTDPRVPVAVRARTLERAEHVRTLAERMTVVQFRAAALVQIYANAQTFHRLRRLRIIIVTRTRYASTAFGSCYGAIFVFDLAIERDFL